MLLSDPVISLALSTLYQTGCHLPSGREKVCCRRFPLGLREDELRDDDTFASRVEGKK